MTEEQHRSKAGKALVQVADEMEEEVDKLEEDVNRMAQKIAEFRETLPEKLQNTLASILSAQRPVISNHRHSDNDPGPSTNAANQESVALVEDDVAHTKKIQTIKEKISSNTYAMSSVLKRMKGCMSRIEKLDSFNNGIIHPAFKRRRKQDCFK